MAQTPKTEVNFPAEFIINEWDYRFTREVVTFRQASGSTKSYNGGLITEVTTGKHGPLATAANAAGILITPITNLATATDLAGVVVLTNGPAIVNEDLLDSNGQTLATAVAALAAKNIKTMKLPIKRTTLS